jgi:glyoxylase-like metal-dependent hydrolase (beta-lactamase superfamily II)
MPSQTSATVRMYRLDELGDCFLITFAAAGQTSRMLLDCGSFRNRSASVARLQQITAHIKTELAGAPLDVVVGTHQHNDHVSGFVHCEQAFRAIGVEQVWLSWLDDPADRMARSIGKEHNNLRLALYQARTEFRSAPRAPKAARALKVLDDVLGFYGARGTGTPPELPENAVKVLKSIGRKEPSYLRPGQILDMPGLPSGQVRIYVLGPPRMDELLYRKDPRKGESYDHSLAFRGLSARKFLDAVAHHGGSGPSSDEEHYPFAIGHKRPRGALARARVKEIKSRYARRGDGWRTIDDDWMEQAETLALYLDTFTNNSSLVLAVELVESGKVLLFVADAQTGNWLSWPDVKWSRPGVTTSDLLARTILYKVGHHASHNATLVSAFEEMRHPHLAALIPVHKKDPNIKKNGGWKMPARNLMKRLVERTSGRVLQMDGVNPPACDPRKGAKKAWQQAGVRPKITPLYIELEIAG